MRVGRPAAPPASPAPDGDAGEAASPEGLQPPSLVGPGRWTWALLAAAGAALFIGIYAAAVLTEPGQRAENLALLGSDFRSELDRERSLQRLSPISTVTFAIALVGALFLAFARSRAVLGFTVVGLMVVSVVLAEALKLWLPRPPLLEGPPWLLRNSFPSGTAAVAAAIAVGSVLLLPDRLRWLGLLLGAGAVALVAHALQVTGWHRLSDVVASTVLVLTVSSAAIGILAATGRSARLSPGAIHPGVYGLVAALAVAALVVAALMLVLLALFPTLGAPVGSRRAFHQAAFPLLGAGASVLALTAFARVLDGWSIGAPGDDAR